MRSGLRKIVNDSGLGRQPEAFILVNQDIEYTLFIDAFDAPLSLATDERGYERPRQAPA